MVQRSECLCDGKIVGIETIYEVIDGDNINISGNIEYLRRRSKQKELFCPCGCGTNLTLVAGEKQLREQHFRININSSNPECTYKPETKVSMYSKVILKCWLDDKLKNSDLESRVQIHAVDDINRKYEFTFLIRNKRLALSYHYDKINLIDEKLDILESNSNGIKIFYILDNKNRSNNGQYPERILKIQRKQGYCLFLELDNVDYKKTQIESLNYSKAKLTAVFYIKNAYGKWEEVKFEEAYLKDFSFDISGNITINGVKLKQKLDDAADRYYDKYIQEEIRIQEEEKKRLAEEQVRREKALAAKHKKVSLQNREIASKKHSGFPCIMISAEQLKQIDITQRREIFVDENYNRLIKCKYCKETKAEEYFGCIGENNIRNLGICKSCYNNPDLKSEFYPKT